MASKGIFPDGGDDAPLEELVAKRILKGSVVSGMLGRVVAVRVWPAGAKGWHRKKVPQVRISRPTTRRPNVSALITVPDVDAPTILSWLAGSPVGGATLEESWGWAVARFPADVSARAVVDWTIAALKTVGASPADGWRYEGEKPDTD